MREYKTIKVDENITTKVICDFCGKILMENQDGVDDDYYDGVSIEICCYSKRGYLGRTFGDLCNSCYEKTKIKEKFIFCPDNEP